MPKKPIVPFQAYTVDEAAEVIGIHPMSLRRKLSAKIPDPFIEKTKPVKIGKEWRFMGDNLLNALGSVNYSEVNNPVDTNISSAGVAIVGDMNKNK